MKNIIMLVAMAFACHPLVLGQTLSENTDIKKLNAQANVLAKKFCDCIVKVGTATNLNGISYSSKKKLISEAGKDFYNYYEAPRMMKTTNSRGKESEKPIHTYLNNLLTQSNSTNSLKLRKYEIRWDKFVLNGSTKDWVFCEVLSDGCKLFCREFRFIQTYRVIDILNKDPELRNKEYTEVDEKKMLIYAIQKPGSGNIIVRLGDISRSLCKDGRDQ